MPAPARARATNARAVLVEACIDSVSSALAAERGGARRLELCAALSDGGTTPSAGMLTAVVAQSALPVVAIIRPRGGDFTYSRAEVDVMRRDIDAARRLGAHGVALGALRADGVLDEMVLRLLVSDAEGLQVSVHRAFDRTPDLIASLEALIALGVGRVLTSGGAATALEGSEQLAALVEAGHGRIDVMAGGGVRAAHVAELVRRSGVPELHVRGTRLVGVGASGGRPLRLRKALPEDEGVWEETDDERVREIVELAQRALTPESPSA